MIHSVQLHRDAGRGQDLRGAEVAEGVVPRLVRGAEVLGYVKGREPTARERLDERSGAPGGVVARYRFSLAQRFHVAGVEGDHRRPPRNADVALQKLVDVVTPRGELFGRQRSGADELVRVDDGHALPLEVQDGRFAHGPVVQPVTDEVCRVRAVLRRDESLRGSVAGKQGRELVKVGPQGSRVVVAGVCGHALAKAAEDLDPPPRALRVALVDREEPVQVKLVPRDTPVRALRKVRPLHRVRRGRHAPVEAVEVRDAVQRGQHVLLRRQRFADRFGIILGKRKPVLVRAALVQRVAPRSAFGSWAAHPVLQRPYDLRGVPIVGQRRPRLEVGRRHRLAGCFQLAHLFIEGRHGRRLARRVLCQTSRSDQHRGENCQCVTLVHRRPRRSTTASSPP